MASNGNIHLLIAIPDQKLREALAFFFSIQDGFEVIQPAATLDDARTLYHEQSPDIMLLDVDELEDHNQASIIHAFHEEDAHPKIVILSFASDDIHAEEKLLAAGAARYIEKGILASQILEIMRQIIRQNQ